MTLRVFLKQGKEKASQQRHPWIFESAVDRLDGAVELGNTAEIYSSNGTFIARGAYSPLSKIRLRIWSWDENQQIDDLFFYNKISDSIKLRKDLSLFDQYQAVRIIFGESDGLPGLLVDQYLDVLVVQFLTAGAEFWKDVIVNLLSECTGINKIFERSDVDVRSLEGLPQNVGEIRGDFSNTRMVINELGIQYSIDFKDGQKTGFYIDQRDNRAKVRSYASGKKVLDCFSYTGGFTISALAGKAASVTAIEISNTAINQLVSNLEINRYLDNRVKWIEGDVFHVLRTMRDRDEKFDLIVLDPPKFAPTIAHVKKASRGYKDINLLALKLLNPGGLLYTFSCSGGLSMELFQKIVFGAAMDAGVNAHIIGVMTQSPDHPVALNFSESNYLKGLIVRKNK